METPSGRIGLGANCLAMTGASSAVRDADPVPDAPLLVPPSVDETNPLTFGCGPAVVAVTGTGIVQDPPAASVPPVNVSRLPPVTTRLPPQVAVVPLDAVRPAGSESLNATPVSGIDPFGLVTVNVSVEAAPTATGFGAKALLSVGGSGVEQPVRTMSS